MFPLQPKHMKHLANRTSVAVSQTVQNEIFAAAVYNFQFLFNIHWSKNAYVKMLHIISKINEYFIFVFVYPLYCIA